MSTFLIADDSKLMRSILGKIIASAGHTVIGEASNGRQAFEEYKSLKPDVVTMDITMDSVSGLEGLRLIREYDPNAVVIMCSSMGQQCLVVEAIQLGAREFILKPFTKEQVYQALDKVFREPQRRR